jgi:hypothetical protein
MIVGSLNVYQQQLQLDKNPPELTIGLLLVILKLTGATTAGRSLAVHGYLNPRRVRMDNGKRRRHDDGSSILIVIKTLFIWCILAGVITLLFF